VPDGEGRRYENALRWEQQEKIKKNLKPGARAFFYSEWTCYRGGATRYYWALLPKGMSEDEAVKQHAHLKEYCGPFSSLEKAVADFERAKQEVK